MKDALCQQTDDEAHLRTVINRAYYAAYCSAAEFLLNETPGLLREDLTHDRVWRSFRVPGDRERWTSSDGMNLTHHRADADYWRPMQSRLPRCVMIDALHRARRVLRLLQAIQV